MKKLFIIIFIIYLIAMLLLAVMPPRETSLPEGTDKVIHAVEFFVLTIILLKLLSFYDIKNKVLIISIIAIIIAIASELIQIPIVERDFSFFDLIADTVGIAGALIWKSLKQ